MEEKKTVVRSSKKHYYYAVGRRKRSVAIIRLLNGKGNIAINGKKAEDYFLNNTSYLKVIKAPLELLSKDKDIDIEAKVKGGGLQGQVEAIRHGIARALVDMSIDFRTSLKKNGYLTRDPRKKERKKYGLKKARKAPQFSKR